ncbi:MAG TPA: glycosyltransferase family A protein [Verrucomicrobiae bacterium]|jgi:glycosyltransferase involved in cell wall biosynthesis
MADSVTVYIATYKRPEYLRDALESVRRQTARSRVAQVIVSENSDSNGSREVCRTFNDLPLEYLQQQPPVPALLHTKAVWPRVKSPIIAILHDDDWWDPQHLADSLGILDSDPGVASVMSSPYETFGPAYPPQVATKVWRVWVGSGCDFRPASVRLDQAGIVVASLLEASFHYSSCVARAGAFYDAYIGMTEAGNDYDNDRLFPILLSFHGAMGYVTKLNVFTRVHPGQDCRRADFLAPGFALKAKTTQWMKQKWPDLVRMGATRFNETAEKMSAGDLAYVSSQVLEPLKSVLINECGFKLAPSNGKITERGSARWFVKQLCPPAILAVRRRLVKQ